MKSKQKALLVAKLAKAKKAEDILVLDLKKVSNITDYFIIATAGSTKRAQTISDNIEKGLREAKEPLSGIEGYQEARWILIDAYDVITHIFLSDVRKFYNLEGLWHDAPRIKLWREKIKKKKHSKKILKKK